ncbi:MAG: hypothetical protein JNK48_22610 [Bryobacterales bacterium]|nr:hypothetical protein [Bryobacterales bacterium]
MRQATWGIKDVLRMHHEEQLGPRQIGEKLNVSSRRVHECIARAHAAGVSWPVPVNWTEDDLRKALSIPSKDVPAERPLPDFEAVHACLQADRSLTLQNLYAVYRQEHPHGYCYSRFCNAYKAWKHEHIHGAAGIAAVVSLVHAAMPV